MWYNVRKLLIKEMNIMGKFSKPRRTFTDSQETVILPKIPAESKPKPAPEAHATQETFDIPPAAPQEEFDAFDTDTGSSAGKHRKVMLISLCSVAAVLLIGVIAAVWFLFGKDPNNHLILNNVYVAGVNLGLRKSLSDVGATVCDFFGVKAPQNGQSFLEMLK